jgi:PAS domain S-box-containing protein
MTDTPLKVLILEDSLNDLELIKELLTDAGYVMDLTHVDNEADFTTALHSQKFDIILSDFSLPGFNAFGALAIRNDYCRDTPFLCISGSIGEEIAIELLKLGAVDYVLKDRPERLPFSLKRALDEAKENVAFKKTLIELQQSKLRFEQVAEDAQEWIWEVDPEGLYTYASPVVSSLLGYTADEIVGKKYFYDFFLPEVKDELKEAALAFFAKRESFRHFENPNVHKNGHLLVLTTSGSPIFDNEGNFEGYRGVDSDITERKKILEELLAAKEKAEESDHLKTAFINNISHEIRTPLNSILGFGQFLSDKELSVEQRQEYFKIIEKSSNRLINTVSDYIDMARIVSGTMEKHNNPFLLKTFFSEVVETYRTYCTDKKIGLEVVVPDHREHLMLDSDKEFIGKTLQLLMDNALKFTMQGAVRCGYSLESDRVVFYVEDTGCGISPNKLEKIFDMFTQEDPSNTRGYEGSGLGLTIAQGLVKLLGGQINVTSSKGNGARFTFYVPARLFETTPPNTVQRIGRENKPLVLIAEDEESNFLFMKVLLSLIDCDYVYAANGAEAVECCRQHEGINLVLMDIKMPVMNGLEATEKIHAFRPDLPIIATTAYAQSGDEHRFLAAGCDGYLSKPINKELLLQLVQKYTKPGS